MPRDREEWVTLAVPIQGCPARLDAKASLGVEALFAIALEGLHDLKVFEHINFSRSADRYGCKHMGSRKPGYADPSSNCCRRKGFHAGS